MKIRHARDERLCVYTEHSLYHLKMRQNESGFVAQERELVQDMFDSVQTHELVVNAVLVPEPQVFDSPDTCNNTVGRRCTRQNSNNLGQKWKPHDVLGIGTGSRHVRYETYCTAMQGRVLNVLQC
uniref:Uncharacterized protein n=1 Tax=Cacopsylla melanoneura TaxID=428564 RepID=A0A8D8QE41_9HEMI